MYRSPDVTKNDRRVEIIDDLRSPANSNESPKIKVKGDDSTQGGSSLHSPLHTHSFKTTPGGKIIKVCDLPTTKLKEQIIEKIERRCLDLSQ